MTGTIALLMLEMRFVLHSVFVLTLANHDHGLTAAWIRAAVFQLDTQVSQRNCLFRVEHDGAVEHLLGDIPRHSCTSKDRKIL